MEHALKFQALSSNNIMDQSFNLFKYEYFIERFNEEFEQAVEYDIPLSLMKIKIEEFDKRSDSQKVAIKRLVAELTKKNLRKMDFAAIGDERDSILALVLGEGENCKKFIKSFESDLDSFGVLNDERFKLSYFGRQIDYEMNSPDELMQSLERI
jgi:hypothetical protein